MKWLLFVVVLLCVAGWIGCEAGHWMDRRVKPEAVHAVFDLEATR
jgi:hypothetical protein